MSNKIATSNAVPTDADDLRVDKQVTDTLPSTAANHLLRRDIVYLRYLVRRPVTATARWNKFDPVLRPKFLCLLAFDGETPVQSAIERREKILGLMSGILKNRDR